MSGVIQTGVGLLAFGLVALSLKGVGPISRLSDDIGTLLRPVDRAPVTGTPRNETEDSSGTFFRRSEETTNLIQDAKECKSAFESGALNQQAKLDLTRLALISRDKSEAIQYLCERYGVSRQPSQSYVQPAQPGSGNSNSNELIPPYVGDNNSDELIPPYVGDSNPGELLPP